MSWTLSCCRLRYSRRGIPCTLMCEVGMKLESPCSPMQMAWICLLLTPMISESARRRRAESSSVPVPKTWLRGSPMLRYRYSVTTSHGLETLMRLPWKPLSRSGVTTPSSTLSVPSSICRRVSPGLRLRPAVRMTKWASAQSA